MDTLVDVSICSDYLSVSQAIPKLGSKSDHNVSLTVRNEARCLDSCGSLGI